ncbi:MAG: hypothetical protein ACHQF0_04405 [Chitinophagales bacterium]
MPNETKLYDYPALPAFRCREDYPVKAAEKELFFQQVSVEVLDGDEYAKTLSSELAFQEKTGLKI